MIISERISKRTSIFICIILLGFSVNIVAFAFDKDYINDPALWNDVDTFEYIEKDDFSGIVKYIVDEQTGCVYINLFYNYPKTTDIDANNIYLSVTVRNDINTYEICVNKDGACFSDGDELTKDIDVFYNFENVNKKYGTGNLYLVIELKSKKDTSQLSYISCEYSISDGDNINILDNLILDMQPATTIKITKETTQKTTAATTNVTTIKTTKVSASKSTTTKKNSTEKSNSTTKNKQTSTKFVPDKISTSADSQTKFSYEASVDSSTVSETETTTISDDEFFSVLNTDKQDEFQSSSKLSSQSKLCIAASAITYFTGIAIIIYSILKKKTD